MTDGKTPSEISSVFNTDGKLTSANEIPQNNKLPFGKSVGNKNYQRQSLENMCYRRKQADGVRVVGVQSVLYNF